VISRAASPRRVLFQQRRHELRGRESVAVAFCRVSELVLVLRALRTSATQHGAPLKLKLRTGPVSFLSPQEQPCSRPRGNNLRQFVGVCWVGTTRHAAFVTRTASRTRAPDAALVRRGDVVAWIASVTVRAASQRTQHRCRAHPPAGVGDHVWRRLRPPAHATIVFGDAVSRPHLRQPASVCHRF
jgi:hypothetical protein